MTRPLSDRMAPSIGDAMLDADETVKVVLLTRFEISRALGIPDSNIHVRVDHFVHRAAGEMVSTIQGLVDELPEDREDYDYTNEWQRFKAKHLPTFVQWNVLRRPKMYRSKVVIRVCPHIEMKDHQNHFEFVTWGE